MCSRLYLESLKVLGIDPLDHDIRFVEDDWESPTLGASGLGWEVWLDGMEITQFTYFQQAGSIELSPISVELTYGLERITMYLQGVDNVYDLQVEREQPNTATCTTNRKWNNPPIILRWPMCPCCCPCSINTRPNPSGLAPQDWCCRPTNIV